MQSKISTPVAVLLIVIVAGIVAFAYWRSQQARVAPTDEKGIPLAPVEARPGANALQDLWKKGVQPPKTQ